MLCFSLFTFYFPIYLFVLHAELLDRIKTFKVSSSHQQLKNPPENKEKQT